MSESTEDDASKNSSKSESEEVGTEDDESSLSSSEEEDSKGKKGDKPKRKDVKISTKFTEAMDKLAQMALDVKNETVKFKSEISEEYANFELMKLNAIREKDIMQRRGTLAEEVIELNVGGQLFTTFKSTLLKANGSMLEGMFSGEFKPGTKDKNGRVFLDRPPKPFEAILDALRTDNPLEIPEDENEKKLYEAEVAYFGLKEYFRKDLKGNKRGFLKDCKTLSGTEQKTLKKWIGVKGEKPWKCLYKATRDGFDGITFRTNCSNKGPSVTVITAANGYIFGGYSSLSWNVSGNYQFDQKCFLFSCKNASGRKMVKLDNNGPSHSNTYSIYNGSGDGPTFGGGHDLYICSNSNTNNSSYSNLGHSYSGPVGMSYGSTQIQNYLAGSYNFMTIEIEVYCRDGA
jgi:hypothetical protein